MDDEEEVVDPKPILEEKCQSHCQLQIKQLTACEKRIAGDTTGEKHCTGQYFDYWKCIDHCVAPKLMSHLK